MAAARDADRRPSIQPRHQHTHTMAVNGRVVQAGVGVQLAAQNSSELLNAADAEL